MNRLTRLLLLTTACAVLITACADTTATEVAVLPTNTLAPLVTLTPRQTATPFLTRTPPPTFTYTPSITPIPPTATHTFTPSPVPPIIGIITSLETVNVRRGPGVSFPAFVALTPGTGVEVLGTNPEGTWLNVRLEDGGEGWVSAGLVRIPPTPTPILLVTGSADAAATAAGLPTAVVGGGVITPTLPAATATPPGAPTATVPASATPNLPIIDTTAINLTATAISAGVNTATPTSQATGGGSAPATTISASPAATGVVRRNVDVLAYCDDRSFRTPPPDNLAAGSTINVFWGWFARTEDQIRQHRNAVVYEVRLNGQLLENWEQYARPVRLEADGNYHVYWFYPSPPLSAGVNRITYRVSWTSPITDGYQSFGPGTNTPFEEGSCTFTVR